MRRKEKEHGPLIDKEVCVCVCGVWHILTNTHTFKKIYMYMICAPSKTEREHSFQGDDRFVFYLIGYCCVIKINIVTYLEGSR